MIMTTDGKALTELCLEDWWWAAPATTASTTPATTEAGAANALPVFRQTKAWLNAYFADEHPTLDSAPPLSAQGTPFQHEVWDLITEIPYGQTVSYGAIAAELAERRGGRRMAAQAVGGAVKRNPITIIVPCHRVVGSGRSFGGYGGHLDVKAELLDLEGVDLSRFDLPH
nr:methylated-DNA--[protein]-cysteine S-methyltransferase [Bifidobacterium scaligerum]